MELAFQRRPHRALVRTAEGGDVELDAYGRGAEAWLVEAKAERTKATKRDLEALEAKAEAFGRSGYPVGRLWFVALAGFTPEATTFAQARGVFITTGPQLSALWLELQKRKKPSRITGGRPASR